MKANSNPEVYAVKLKNKADLVQSSSGGAFTAISDYFLSKGDLVVASHYDYDTHQQVFGLIESKEARDDARGSKYVKSIPGDIFNIASGWLIQHSEKKLVFFGMGCQVDGFRKFLEMRGVRERACLVDIVCTGGVSPRLWEEYISNIESNKNNKISLITFKDKINGWKQPTAVALTGGRDVSLRDYVSVFNSGCALMPCCYKCPYTSVNRNSDVTIGDYWGIEKIAPEFYDRNGVSLVLLHTEFGKRLFVEIENEIEFLESNINDCLQPRLKEPIQLSVFRDSFWKDYKVKGASYAIRKYSNIDRKGSTMKNRIKLALHHFR